MLINFNARLNPIENQQKKIRIVLTLSCQLFFFFSTIFRLFKNDVQERVNCFRMLTLDLC